MYFRYVWCLFVVCCKICRGNIIATNVTGYGGDTTVFTCSSPDISPGDDYILTKDGTVIYRSSNEGITVDEKYNAAAEDGNINMNILNTNISDAGKYKCDHNFDDASGTVSVAFRPENVTATASQQEHMWKLSVSAYKVFPLEANITGASCFGPDNTVAIFQRENQVVITNNEEQYLYDIFWNGTIARTLSGDVQCNITIVVIDTIVRTINVSFQDSPPEDCKVCCWCKIIPWWWCIILIVISASIGGGGVGTLGYWKYKRRYLFDTPRTWPCSSSKPPGGERSAAASHVKMSGNSSEKSNDVNKGLPGNNSGNETSRETKPPRTNGPNALHPMTGYSKVRPDDNQRSGDPDKNTPNNEANYTPRPLPILPNIRSSQAPNIDDVETETPKKKKKKKRKQTKEDQIV